MAIPKRVNDRIKSTLRVFKKVLADARTADRSEQDTVTIVTDILSEVFGYDKYSELTGEYAIRGTYCDLAVKIKDKIQFLVEVKAIGKSLNDNHLRQATDYAAKEGIEWVVLTNGVEWHSHRMIFEQPVRHERVFSFDLIDGGSEVADCIFMLSKEGISKSALDKYHEQRQVLSRHMVAAILLSEPVIKVMRRELKRISPDVRIDADSIEDVLKAEVLKRDILESDELKNSKRVVSRAGKRSLRQTDSTSETTSSSTTSGSDSAIRSLAAMPPANSDSAN